MASTKLAQLPTRDGRLSFARIPEVMEMPYLLETQKESYRQFLQYGIPADQRQSFGLQEVFRSVFPIAAPGNPSTLEFVQYDFGMPKYDIRECIERGMTYASPLKVRLQLIVRETEEATRQTEVRDIKEQEIYLGDIPLMTPQGTFIINGAERVVVSQLHRSPGVSFSSGVHPNGRTTYGARIIPYRGAWVELEVDPYNVMWVMIDRKRKIPATTFLRAFGFENDEQIAAEFFQTDAIPLDDFSQGMTKITSLEQHLGSEFVEDVIEPKLGKMLVERGAKVTRRAIEVLKEHKIKAVALDTAEGYEEILGRILAADVTDSSTGEILAECWDRVTTSLLRRCADCHIKKIKVLSVADEGNDVLLATLEKDRVKTYEEAVIEIFKRLRPGNPLSFASGKRLLEETFFSQKRYDLGSVGRYKINRRFQRESPDGPRILTARDIVDVMKHLIALHREQADVDDIDHLGNRRVRSVGELLQNQIRLGLAELEKTARDRMGIVDLENLLPHNLINPKPVAQQIRDFFGRSQLSQFMDQTNPLSELTHKRRLSALGPGGLSRERAGFDVRDVHHTHYGRICPIETPEGPNIGLISSLSTYARINEFGFIETPYRKVRNGRVTEEVEYLTADIEDEHVIAQANAPLDAKGMLAEKNILCRYRGDFPRVARERVDYMDVSPKQLVSVSSALIPFLEHDDANRALMGSNMQRQAVPLVVTETPLIGTGIEHKVAVDSGVCSTAKNEGVVEFVDAGEIRIRNELGGLDIYRLQKFQRSNQNTCMNQKPTVDVGQKIEMGQVIADGPACDRGDLALGRNVLCAFMVWGGYNFEDAILINDRLVKDDVFTSIHIEEFEIEARDTKLGKEEITRDIPNVSEDALAKLDDEGLVLVGSEVEPGDILVGKVTPKGETDLTSEEKLLRAIFGEKAGDVRDASLRVPPGSRGIVVDTKVFSRKERAGRTDRDEKKQIEEIEKERDVEIERIRSDFYRDLKGILKDLDREIINFETGHVELKPGSRVNEQNLAYIHRSLKTGVLPVDGKCGAAIKTLYQAYSAEESKIADTARNKIDRIKTGDELPAGVLKLVKVHVAVKRKLSVGDKMAGRHGNKGVIAKILPAEDMPFLEDGTAVDIVLNPLGVPSRMNVGQILETHLGWAARVLGLRIGSPVFDGAREEQIRQILGEAGLPGSGQTVLYDGRTGEPFDRPITVGQIYMMKLAHLVDDKMHARSIGPYSLVTQQPLGGKAQFGGQRFGEMEVWALEAYGAAYTLQEILTVKSDDVIGRTLIYESIVKGENILKAGTPESFNVLVKELQSLCLNLELLTEDALHEEKPEEAPALESLIDTAEEIAYFDEAEEEEEEKGATEGQEAEF
jgi:DNA-directed RNA polymerase subunit beta